MRAIKTSVRQLRGQIKSTSLEQSLATGGKDELGTRALPKKTAENDLNIGVRIDYGKRYTDKAGQLWQNLKLQINKNAAGPTLRELANKDAHVYAEADMAVGPKEEPEQAVTDFFQRLETSLHARSSEGSKGSKGSKASKEIETKASSSPNKSKGKKR